MNAQQCVEKWTAGTLLHEAATAGEGCKTGFWGGALPEMLEERGCGHFQEFR